MTPNTLIAARPHFRREGNELFFFLSARPFHSLSIADAEAWEALSGGAVRSRDLPDLEAVQSLVEAGVAEEIEPVTEQNRRRILVIEPHCDDAALSIGATMWKMRHTGEFHLLTMASRSNYTTAFHLHRDFFEREKITAMRTAEGKLFMAHLGGYYYTAGLPEATLRYADSDWSLDFFEAHEVPTAISNNRRAPRTVLDTWTEALGNFIKGKSFDEIWAPLGAGTHSDHDLARNAALEVLMRERRNCIIRLYEDVPYGAEFREHTDRILATMREAGATLDPWPQDITADYSKKLALLSIFASQFKVRSIEPGVERSAHFFDGSGPVERLWTVDHVPTNLPADKIWIGAPEVASSAHHLRQFRIGALSSRRLAIFAINAAGRWGEDLARIGQLFPAAKVVVYAGPQVSSEFRMADDPRLELHCLNGRAVSWIRAALREVFTSHRLVIAGKAVPKARMLTSLWLSGRKLVCIDMDHFIQALARAF